MASCIQVEGLIQAYMDDDLSVSVRVMFEAHIASCETCSRKLRDARATATLIFETLQKDRLEEDLVPCVMAHLPEMEQGAPIPSAASAYIGQEQKAQRRGWLRSFPALMPVLAPLIILVLAALLWTTWPTVHFGGERAVGVVTYGSGAVFTGHVSHTRQKRTHVKDVITDGETFATDEEGRLQLGLTGPTHIAVYANTALEVKNSREIVLNQGRVFLDVSRDVQRFCVHTPDGRVTVLGTSFHIDIGNSGTEVTVVNGEVLAENDRSFVLLARGSQALIHRARQPVVTQNIDVTPYLAEARAIRPDTVAERYFLARIAPEPTVAASPGGEQVFVVNTRGRAIDALMLRWIPGPYTHSHAEYHVYVSDNAMTPLFRATAPASLFGDKTKGSYRIDVPTDVETVQTSVLHITITPAPGAGIVETSFTDISAIGVKP